MTRTEPFEVDLEVGKNFDITSHFTDQSHVLRTCFITDILAISSFDIPLPRELQIAIKTEFIGKILFCNYQMYIPKLFALFQRFKLARRNLMLQISLLTKCSSIARMWRQRTVVQMRTCPQNPLFTRGFSSSVIR